MKEIKFRAFDPLAKRFVLVKSLNFNTHGDLFTLMLKENGKESIQGAGAYPISQYTGLKDKNGKEIYEGDIVRVSPEEGLHTGLKNVFWNDHGCWEPFVFPNDPTCSQDDNEKCEVIGNIYENTELLKRHC